MQTATIDFETFWSTDFSLTKVSFIEYIKSPEFEAISVSIKLNDGDTKTVFGHEQIKAALDEVDWHNTACVAHNGNEFDFPLLVWVFDCHPRLFIDTICMSRPKHQSEAGGSLKKLSAAYGLPDKDNTVLLNTKGKRYIEFDLNEMAQMAKYNKTDVDNTYALFRTFLKDTPRQELLLSDMTARMICYPQLRCDRALLLKTLKEAQAEKELMLEGLIAPLGALDVEEVREELASSAKFAQVLRSFGVEPPVKISKTTGKPTLALAKTDDEFLALQDHPDLRVQALVAGRLGVKSTLLETRLEKMATCAALMNDWMPVPLAYHSATTGRWGGRVWNPQNLPRIPRDKQGNIINKLTNALRLSLVAPDRYKVVVSDLSGIELRVNHYLWNVQSTQALYDEDPKADLYKAFAAVLFGVPESAVTKDQRQLAKVAQLGLGFGAGAKTFQKVAKLMGGIDLDEDEALRVTNAWRTKYVDIVQGWRKCQQLVAAMHSGLTYSPDPRGLVTSLPGAVRLPSGRLLYYPGLRQELDDKGKVQFRYGTGKNESKVYAGLMDENLVQAIARDVIAEQALQIKAQTGYYPALSVHDELVYVVPEEQAESMLAKVNAIMRTPPAWLPGIVLWSEGDIAGSYGEAK